MIEQLRLLLAHHKDAPDSEVAQIGTTWGDLRRLVAQVPPAGTRFIAYDVGTDHVVVSIPRELLMALQRSWILDSDIKLTIAVRDLFEGQDGELQFLSRIGITADYVREYSLPPHVRD